MAYNLQIIWSELALFNLNQIFNYLQEHWTAKEIASFKENLNVLLKTICKYPYGYPVSRYNHRLRKAVLSKQSSVIYEVKENEIFVVAIIDNRQSV